MDKKVLILGSAFFGVSLGIFFAMAALVKNFLQSKNKVLLYSFLFVLCFCLVGLLAFKGLFQDPLVLLITLQLCFLALGVVHVIAVYNYLEWTSQNSILSTLGFTLFITLIGAIPYLFIVKALHDSGYHFLLLGATLLFVIPYFFRQMFDAAMLIPKPVLKHWYFPVNEKPEDPSSEELKQPFVISFKMQKSPETQKVTVFRAKAPAKIHVAKLFYFFVDDYNTKNANSNIMFADKYGRPYGWSFYLQPKWYKLYKKEYIDPDVTVEENGIRENSVIVCERIIDEKLRAYRHHLN